MSQNAMLTRITEPISIDIKLNTQFVSPIAQRSPQIFGFGSWLDPLKDVATHEIGWTALANMSPKSIWHTGDIPSPTCNKLHLCDKPTLVVHPHCELMHPRPKMSWVITHQNVCEMEAQAASMAEEREREIRASSGPDDAKFERSDDDEIWPAALVALPRGSKSSSHSTPTGPI